MLFVFSSIGQSVGPVFSRCSGCSRFRKYGNIALNCGSKPCSFQRLRRYPEILSNLYRSVPPGDNTRTYVSIDKILVTFMEDLENENPPSAVEQTASTRCTYVPRNRIDSSLTVMSEAAAEIRMRIEIDAREPHDLQYICPLPVLSLNEEELTDFYLDTHTYDRTTEKTKDDALRLPPCRSHRRCFGIRH